MNRKIRRLLSRTVAGALTIGLVGGYLTQYGLSLWNIPWFKQPPHLIEARTILSGNLQRGFFAGEYRDLYFSNDDMRLVKITEDDQTSSNSIKFGATAAAVYLNGKHLSGDRSFVTTLKELRLYVEKTPGSASDYRFEVTQLPISSAIRSSELNPFVPILIHWDQIADGRWRATLNGIENLSTPIKIIPLNVSIFPGGWPYDIPVEIQASGGRGSFSICLEQTLNRDGIAAIRVNTDSFFGSTLLSPRNFASARAIDWNLPIQSIELEMRISREKLDRCTSPVLSNTEQAETINQQLRSFQSVALLVARAQEQKQ